MQFEFVVLIDSGHNLDILSTSDITKFHVLATYYTVLTYLCRETQKNFEELRSEMEKLKTALNL